MASRMPGTNQAEVSTAERLRILDRLGTRSTSSNVKPISERIFMGSPRNKRREGET
jgi:hypothetical protein